MNDIAGKSFTPTPPGRIAPLSFDDLRNANVRRCESAYHGVDEWSPTDWACAMAGEAGEACNEVKKLRRIAPTPEDVSGTEASEYAARIEAVGKELADIVIYADLLAARLGLDLGVMVSLKFNEVSRRIGSDVVVPEPAY